MKKWIYNAFPGLGGGTSQKGGRRWAELVPDSADSRERGSEVA